MAIEIILRKDARAIGRVRYFTGKPCKRAHIAERLISDGTCIECANELRRKLYTQNPEKFNEALRRRRSKNPEKFRAAKRKQRAKNTEKFREQDKKHRARTREKHRDADRRWHAKNPGKAQLYSNNRRALRLNAVGSHTHKQILELFRKQKAKCVNCRCSIKSSYHVDHITPLSRGGSNYISNIQLLCPRCNLSKGGKHPIIWAQQNGRLL